jgi:CRP-like cAMP-binding protein
LSWEKILVRCRTEKVSFNEYHRFNKYRCLDGYKIRGCRRAGAEPAIEAIAGAAADAPDAPARKSRDQAPPDLDHWNMPIEHVYFIEHGLVSVSAKVGGDSSVEVWLIGCEGMTGVPAVLSDHNAPPHRRVVQVGGKALRISIHDFHHALREATSLRDILLRYVHLVLLQATQSGACNANHLFKQRLARWLLTAREALQADEIPLTHLVLGRLLGVRRPSVTECLSVLESEEAIHSARGVIRIVDSRKLESISCDCHRIIRREYERVFSH